MFTLAFVCGAAAALLVFLFFLAEEMDLRRETNEAGPWTPTFLALYVLGFVMLAFGCCLLLCLPYVTVPVYRFASRWRRVDPATPAGAAQAAAEDEAAAAAAARVTLADGFITVVFWTVFLLMVRALVVALERSDRSVDVHRSPFVVVEVLFCVLVGIFVFVTIAGMAATYNEYRFNGVGSRCLSLFGCCTQAYRDAAAQSADVQSERNTHAAPALRKMYAERQPYQNNKLVWLGAPGVMPYDAINLVHVALLLLNVVAVFVASLLLFIRLRQIGEVQAQLVGTASSAALATEAAAQLTTLSPPRFAAAGGWLGGGGDEWPDAAELRNHVIFSLADWRGKVMPLAVVFIPLFIAQGLLVLWLPFQAVTYWLRPTPFSHWVQGSVYLVVLAMLLLFEALFSARVDDGVLGRASWHNTFAPLYAALLYTIPVLALSTFCTPPTRVASPAPSYCGLVVA
jgi:hypothetical protein